jgi:hypothetical protein
MMRYSSTHRVLSFRENAAQLPHVLASYLETLSREAGEPFDDSLSKAEASKRIDELRQRSPRIAGTDAGDQEKAPRA